MNDLTDFRRLQNKPINSILTEFFEKDSAANVAEEMQTLWYLMLQGDAMDDMTKLELSNLSYNLDRVVELLHALEKFYIETHHEEQQKQIAMKLRELTNQNQSL